MKSSKAYLTYALKDGELVHIDSVPNGNECGCKCPHCNGDLCAKNGGSSAMRVHHFAHQNGTECVGAIESALHILTKDVLKDVLCVQLPDRLDGSKGELMKFDRVETEVYDKTTQLRPDCIGYYGNNVLWIEFKRSHAVDRKKRGKIISAEVDCIELDINECELDPNALQKFIMEETHNRIWIRDTNAIPRKNSESDYYGIYCNKNDAFYSEHKPIKRVFASDENGKLVNLLIDKIDTNIHSYYCLACGKELSLDLYEFDEYSFVHTEENVECDDDRYLCEAAKNILFWRFSENYGFCIAVNQWRRCDKWNQCSFYSTDECGGAFNEIFNLKDKNYGYSECVMNCVIPEIQEKCDLVIKKPDTFHDAIVLNVNTKNHQVVKNTAGYRELVVNVFNEDSLLSLIDKTLSNSNASLYNFVEDGRKMVSPKYVKRDIIKFSLYSSGYYYVESINCSKINSRKQSTVLEYIFVEGIEYNRDAKLYSLLRCKEQKMKACYCEICCYLKRYENALNMSERICMRYKTKGTPHYPLNLKEGKPINCPFFGLNKDIEDYIKSECKNVKIIEK